jgi:hypothetical protein
MIVLADADYLSCRNTAARLPLLRFHFPADFPLMRAFI